MKRNLIGNAAALALLLVGDQAHAVECPDGLEINEVLNNGSRWEMCWDVSSDTGLHIAAVHYTTPSGLRRRMIKSAHLAQLAVIMNDSSTRLDHVAAGEVGTAMLTLDATRCRSGALLYQSGRPLACLQRRDRGYSGKYYSTAFRGEQLSLSSVSALGTGDYIQQWNFLDSGEIEARMGHTGTIGRRSANDADGWPVTGGSAAAAVAFAVDYVWMVDPDIGVNGNDDAVETLEIRPDTDRLRKRLSTVRETREFAHRFDADIKRSWRFLDPGIRNADGHAVSLHVSPIDTGQHLNDARVLPAAANDIYVTRFRECERLASNNPGSCGSGVTQYVNGESIDRADVVMWYRTSFYRLPRSDDRAGYAVRWAGFRIVPRDWTAEGVL